MVKEFKRRLKELSPSYIISTHYCSYGHLNMIACAYARNENFYLAVSYYTVSWIGANPVFPNPPGEGTEDGLGGIADIKRFCDLDQLTVACNTLPKEKDMEGLAEQICKEAQKRYDKVFRTIQGTDSVEWVYTAAPVPAIVAVVRTQAGVLQGTLVIPISGAPYIAMECSPRIRRTYLRYVTDLTRDPIVSPMCLE